MSFSPDRVRVRGRSPAFNALAAAFENPGARNLSTPPPVGRKLYPKSVTPDSAKSAPKSAAIAALSSSFEQPPSARDSLIPRSIKGAKHDYHRKLVEFTLLRLLKVLHDSSFYIFLLTLNASFRALGVMM